MAARRYRYTQIHGHWETMLIPRRPRCRLASPSALMPSLRLFRRPNAPLKALLEPLLLAADKVRAYAGPSAMRASPATEPLLICHRLGSLLLSAVITLLSAWLLASGLADWLSSTPSDMTLVLASAVAEGMLDPRTEAWL